MSRPSTVSFCGIDFWNGPISSLIDSVKSSGGYIVLPSAPSFSQMRNDDRFKSAMLSADYAIVDSSLLAVFMTLLLRRRIRRVSGLRFLQHLLLYHPEEWFAASRLLWVSPNELETQRIKSFLARHGLGSNSCFYQAPHYKSEEEYRDGELDGFIKSNQPDVVIICIGGGRQELLAYEMRSYYGHNTPIICTGAAIAFLTGGQARIPTPVDRIGLGWLARILQHPRLYMPRYFQAAWAFPLTIYLHYLGARK